MNELSTVGMLTLTVSERRDQDYIQLAANEIQRMPGVVRVRVEPSFNQIEIAFRRPTNDLLLAVHNALRTAGGRVADGRKY
jgi:hypothetical protein